MDTILESSAKVIAGNLQNIKVNRITANETDLSEISIADGDALAPSLNFISDPDTGFYRSASGVVSVASNASKAIDIDASNVVIVGDVAANNLGEGTYTPTVSNEFNMTPSALTGRYIRFLDTIIVYVAADHTAGAGGNYSYRITLPVARGSNFSGEVAAIGSGSSIDPANGITIRSVDATQNVLITGIATDTSTYKAKYQFMYSLV